MCALSQCRHAGAADARLALAVALMHSGKLCALLAALWLGSPHRFVMISQYVPHEHSWCWVRS